MRLADWLRVESFDPKNRELDYERCLRYRSGGSYVYEYKVTFN